MTWQQAYLDRWYSRSRGWVDGTAQFHALCSKFRLKGETVLEIGAGPANSTTDFLADAGPVFGVDPDQDVLKNKALSDARVSQDSRIPHPDRSFNACVSNFVLEHVRDPELHLAEIYRVLRPGGYYVFRTPNRWHYVTLVACMTPHWFHELVANPLRGHGAEHHAPYPTFYRLNSRSQIEAMAARTGLQVKELHFVEKEPSYGMASRFLFIAFMLYERMVNASDALWFARASIFGVLQRPPADAVAVSGGSGNA